MGIARKQAEQFDRPAIVASADFVRGNDGLTDLDNAGQKNRDDKTAIELFLAGIRGWEAGLRRRMGDVSP
jgi:hypothetical protein